MFTQKENDGFSRDSNGFEIAQNDMEGGRAC